MRPALVHWPVPVMDVLYHIQSLIFRRVRGKSAFEHVNFNNADVGVGIPTNADVGVFTDADALDNIVIFFESNT
jgi:hypothetical protein